MCCCFSKMQHETKCSFFYNATWIHLWTVHCGRKFGAFVDESLEIIKDRRGVSEGCAEFWYVDSQLL